MKTIEIGSLADFLRSIGLLHHWQPGTSGDRITGLASAVAANPGALSWLSQKICDASPEQALSFRGTALLVPDVSLSGLRSKAHLLAVTKPRLALARAAHAFFPELFESHLPESGASPVAGGASVDPTARLSHGVVIGPNVVIGRNVVIGPNTVIDNAIVASGVRIGANCSIGFLGFGFERDADGHAWRFPHIGRVLIGESAEIGCNTCIDRGSLGDTIIGRAAWIDNLVHIAHNVEIGARAAVVANAMIGGSSQVGDDAWIAPGAAIRNQIVIGPRSVVGLGAVVVRDVSPDSVVYGNPAVPKSSNAEKRE